MDKSDAAASRGQTVLGSKRPASEELKNAPDTKRVEGLENDTAESEAQPPAAPRRVPFPEKVCTRSLY